MQCIGVCSVDGGREVPERDRTTAVAVLLVDGPEAVTNSEHILVAARSPHGQVEAHTEVLPHQSRRHCAGPLVDMAVAGGVRGRCCRHRSAWETTLGAVAGGAAAAAGSAGVASAAAANPSRGCFGLRGAPAAATGSGDGRARFTRAAGTRAAAADVAAPESGDDRARLCAAARCTRAAGTWAAAADVGLRTTEELVESRNRVGSGPGAG